MIWRGARTDFALYTSSVVAVEAIGERDHGGGKLAAEPRSSEYEPAFRDNQIDAEVLPNLTGEDLKELGVASVGHRRKLLLAIAQLSKGSPSRPPPSRRRPDPNPGYDVASAGN